MRLQEYEVNCIKAIANNVFGRGSKVILFGSCQVSRGCTIINISRLCMDNTYIFSMREHLEELKSEL